MRDTPSSKAFAHLVSALYDAAFDDRLWETYLTSLAAGFGSDQALLVSVDKVPLTGALARTVGMDMDIIAVWEGSKEHIDVWYQAVQNIQQSKVYEDIELSTKSHLRRSGFYADMLKPLNVEHTLGCAAVENDARTWAFAIFASHRSGPFSKDQRALYECLLPHFNRAIRLRQILSKNTSTERALVDGLNKLRVGVVILDSTQHSVFVNSKADTLFRDNDGATMKLGQIALEDRDAQARLNEAIQGSVLAAIVPTTSSTLRVSRPSGKKELIFFVCPIGRKYAASESMSDARHIIFIHDPVQTGLSFEFLQQDYGLTKAEWTFCQILFESGSLKESIRRLDIRRNTAKSHLARIFEKMRVSSQVQLIQIIATEIMGRPTDD